jgi:hypothetical protein
LELVIGGFDEEGKKNGVYIWPEPIQKRRRGFRFEIRGKLGKMEGSVDEAVEILEKKKGKQNINGKGQRPHGYRIFIWA